MCYSESFKTVSSFSPLFYFYLLSSSFCSSSVLLRLCLLSPHFFVSPHPHLWLQFGDSQQLRLVRILRSTVMVRVGGGWMALDEFLVKNDPCRGEQRLHIVKCSHSHTGTNCLTHNHMIPPLLSRVLLFITCYSPTDSDSQMSQLSLIKS